MYAFSVNLWTVARQPPLSMGFSRQEYWSGLPCPPPGDLLDQGIKCMQADAELQGSPIKNVYIVKVKVLVIQSCLTVCNSKDCSPPGFSVHGIFQARILEWVAIPFRGSSPPRNRTDTLAFPALTGRFFTTELLGKQKDPS